MLRGVAIVRVMQEADGTVGASVVTVPPLGRRTTSLKHVSASDLSELAQRCREHIGPKDTVVVFVEKQHVLVHAMDIPRVAGARRLSAKRGTELRLHSSVREISGADPSETYWLASAPRNGRAGILVHAGAHFCEAFADALPGRHIEFRAPGLGWTPRQVGRRSGRNVIVLWSKEPCGVAISLYQSGTLLDLRLPRGVSDPGLVQQQVIRTIRFFTDRYGPVDGVTVVSNRSEGEVRAQIAPNQLGIAAEKIRVLTLGESPHVRDAILQITYGVPALGRGGRYFDGLVSSVPRSWRNVAAAASVAGSLALVAMVTYGLNVPVVSNADHQHELNPLQREQLLVERERRLTEVGDGVLHTREWKLALESTRAAPAVFAALEGALVPDTHIEEVVVRGTDIRLISGYSPSVVAVLEHLRTSELVRSPSLIGPVIEESHPADPERRRQRFSLGAEVVPRAEGPGMLPAFEARTAEEAERHEP